MDILYCILKIYPDWNGVVWGNSYEGIKPHELETRPIPTLAELESIWPEVEIEKIKLQEANNAKIALEIIDLKSIRSIREWVSNQSNAPQILKDYENQAKSERVKLSK